MFNPLSPGIGKLCAPIALAAACLVAPGAAQAQEPNWQFSGALAPFYDGAPQEDILDLKLGMNVDTVLVVLAGNGFRVMSDEMGRTARGRGSMRYLDAERAHEGTRPS